MRTYPNNGLLTIRTRAILIVCTVSAVTKKIHKNISKIKSSPATNQVRSVAKDNKDKAAQSSFIRDLLQGKRGASVLESLPERPS
jgi:hypothetical protein